MHGLHVRTASLGDIYLNDGLEPSASVPPSAARIPALPPPLFDISSEMALYRSHYRSFRQVSLSGAELPSDGDLQWRHGPLPPPPLPPLPPRAPPSLTGSTAESGPGPAVFQGAPQQASAAAEIAAAVATAATAAAATTAAAAAAISATTSVVATVAPTPTVVTPPAVAKSPFIAPSGRGWYKEHMPDRYRMAEHGRLRRGISEPQLRRFMRFDPLMVSWLRSRHRNGQGTSSLLFQPVLGRIKESVFGASQSSLNEVIGSDAELNRASHVLRGRVSVNTDPHDGAGVCARMGLLGELSTYMVPLFLVFWAEYACQSCAWTAFALPEPRRIDDAGSRLNAYHTFNLLYQCGVLVSRASGMLFTLPRPVIHALVVLQVALLVAFVGDAATQTITGWPLHAGALAVGLIGGTLYVQMFLLVDREVPPAKREAALATCTCADTAGVLVGEFTGLLAQLCLFDHLNLPARGHCPWPMSSGASGAFRRSI